MKKIFIITAFLSIFIFSGCTNKNEEVIRPVEYIIVQKESDIANKTFFGYLKSASLTDLSFQIEGVLKKIYPLEGQSVKRGQIIALLDAPLYKIQVQEAKYNLSNAQIQYQNAKNYFERIQKLHAAGGISDNDMDNARTKMESANYQIQSARERLNYIAYQAGYEKILAPTDGTLVTKIASEQQYLKPGDVVVKFQSNQDIEAYIYVAQNYINFIKRGQKAKISVDAIKNKSYDSYVKEISETSLEGTSYRVKLKLYGQSPELKDGMSVSAVFKIEENQQSKIYIPINSLLEEDGKKIVFTIENIEESTGTIKKNIVTTGEIKGDNINIISGIKTGDYIVTKGVGEISEGQKVRLK